MYTALPLSVVLLVAVLALPEGPQFSQSMNHMSFPGEIHKLNSFYHRVLLTDKKYNIDSLPW